MQIYAVEDRAHFETGTALFVNVSFVTTFDNAQGFLQSLRGQDKLFLSFKTYLLIDGTSVKTEQ